jgi:hypothetical protein
VGVGVTVAGSLMIRVAGGSGVGEAIGALSGVLVHANMTHTLIHIKHTSGRQPQ